MRSPLRSPPLALVLFTALGCASVPPSPPSSLGDSEPPSPEVVIEWALGSSERVPEPRTADRMLLAVPVNEPLEHRSAVTPHCIHASSFLPVPGDELRIFFLIEKQLYLGKSRDEDPALLAGNDLNLGITRLIAMEKDAEPLRILVAATPQGAAGEEIWRVTVDNRAILAVSPIREYRDIKDQTAFFAKYNVPRCLPGGQRCLVIRPEAGDTYLEFEPTRGKPPEPLTKLPRTVVLDAAWSSTDGDSLYLLTSCGPPG